MSRLTHDSIADFTECPICAATNDHLGGGTGHADVYFNHDGGLWAVCAVHRVRWYVTRDLMCVPPAPPHVAALPVVETDHGRALRR